MNSVLTFFKKGGRVKPMIKDFLQIFMILNGRQYNMSKKNKKRIESFIFKRVFDMVL